MQYKKITCSSCGAVLSQGPTALFDGPCPTCGSDQRFELLAAEELITAADVDIDIRGTSATTGELVTERVSRARGNTRASIASDAGQPSRIAANRIGKINNFADEASAAEALARALGQKESTYYTVEPKEEEDSDYVDRYLITGSSKIPVQITHLDTSQISNLGRSGHFEDDRELEEMKSMIVEAVRRKSQVDMEAKAKTILLLLTPSPLGKIIRRYVQRESFDLMGYKSIWIYPSGEDCFEIFEELPRVEIAQKAYLLWRTEGPYWGNDQHHWFKAIDELRGI